MSIKILLQTSYLTAFIRNMIECINKIIENVFVSSWCALCKMCEKEEDQQKGRKTAATKVAKKVIVHLFFFLGWFVCECQYCRNKNENGFILVFVVFSCDTRVMMNGIKVEEDEEKKHDIKRNKKTNLMASQTGNNNTSYSLSRIYG